MFSRNTKGAAMIRAMVTLTVHDDGDVSKIKQWLAEHGELSRAEPGCVRFEAYQSQQVPSTFYLCEFWETAEALDAHRQAKGFTEIYQPKILPLVERRLDVLDVIA
jgi:quinol monooxygenase YgiN